jgi:hypothetical protein
MESAAYLRARASLCLRIARFISDGRAASVLKANAAEYHARAIEIESRQNSVSVDKAPPDND